MSKQYPPTREGARTVRLTQRTVAALKPTSKLYVVRDTEVPGLVLRISPSGQKAFYVEGRLGKGRSALRKNVKVGDVRLTTLSDARDRAKTILVALRDGRDPTVPIRSDGSLGAVLAEYEKSLVRRKVVKVADTTSAIRRGLKPYLKRSISELKRAEVISAMRRIEAKGKPGAAEYLRKVVTPFLNFAVNEGWVEYNVMAGYRRPRSTRAEKLGREQLTLDQRGPELAHFWLATEQAHPTMRDLLRFLLLTGQRRIEAAKMKWAEVREDGKRCAAATRLSA